MSLLFQNKNYKLATHAKPFGWYKQYVIEERKLRGLHDCTKTTSYRNMTSFISEKDDMVDLGLHYHSFEIMLYRKCTNIVSHTKLKMSFAIDEIYNHMFLATQQIQNLYFK